MSESDLLWDFVVHIVTSHFGYHAARMACAMSIQPVGFALPMTLVTPMTLAVVMSTCSSPNDSTMPMFVVRCLGSDADKAMLIVIAAVLWISQNIIVARNAWNSKSPLLALDEMLFYQPSYNSILLEQYTLLNRREPDGFHEVVQEDPDDPSVRVYICSTVFRESPAEMKQLIISVLRVDKSVRNVFEWHVWMDGGCNGNQLGQYAIQFIACLKEEIERLGDVDVKDWIESGQKMETPYGQRLEWLLPDGTPFALHLKDGQLVKRGKRWSQVCPNPTPLSLSATSMVPALCVGMSVLIRILRILTQRELLFLAFVYAGHVHVLPAAVSCTPRSSKGHIRVVHSHDRRRHYFQTGGRPGPRGAAVARQARRCVLRSHVPQGEWAGLLVSNLRLCSWALVSEDVGARPWHSPLLPGLLFTLPHRRPP